MSSSSVGVDPCLVPVTADEQQIYPPSRLENYSRTFLLVFSKTQSEFASKFLRSIPKHDLRTVLETDLRVNLLLFRSQERMLLYRFLRQSIRLYNTKRPHSSFPPSPLRLWKYLRHSMKSIVENMRQSTINQRGKDEADGGGSSCSSDVAASTTRSSDSTASTATTVLAGSEDNGPKRPQKRKAASVKPTATENQPAPTTVADATTTPTKATTTEAKTTKAKTTEATIAKEAKTTEASIPKETKTNEATITSESTTTEAAAAETVQNNPTPSTAKPIVQTPTNTERSTCATKTQSQRQASGKPEPNHSALLPAISSTCSRVQTLDLEKIIDAPANMILSLSCSPQNIYKIQCRMISPSVLDCTFTNRNIGSALYPLSTQQLLQWPALEMRLQLGSGVSIVREVKGNAERCMLFGRKGLRGIDTEANDMRPRHDTDDATPAAPRPQLSKLMFESFLTMMGECLQSAQMSETRRADLQAVFNVLLKESSPQPRLHLNEHYAQFLVRHPFVRLFGDPFTRRMAKPKLMTIRLRESANPESRFRIVECPFFSETNEDVWTEQLLAYFNAILVQREPQALERLAEMYANCVIVRCTDCDKEFAGADALDAAKEHVLRDHHAKDKRWTCVRCRWHPATDGQMVGWDHDCIGDRA